MEKFEHSAQISLEKINENNFLLMIQNHKSIMLLIEPVSGIIIDANPSAANFYKYPLEQLKGMSIEKINALNPDEVANARLRAAKGENNLFIFPHRLATGEIRTVEVHSSQIEVNNKKLLFSIVHDITERKSFEDKLKKSEEALKKGEEIGKYGHWVLYLDEKLMTSSDGASLIYGLNKNENALEQIQRMALPEYRPMLDRALSDTLTKGSPYNVEFKIKRESDGKIIDIHSVAEFDPSKNILFGTIQDITERKTNEKAAYEREEKFRLIIENTSEAIFFAEPNGTIDFANHAACEMFGYSLEEFISRGRSGVVDITDSRLNIALKEREKNRKI